VRSHSAPLDESIESGRAAGAETNTTMPARAKRKSNTHAGAAMAGEGSLDILLAEDNVVNQLVACRHLRRAGHKVVVANNGALAVSEFASSHESIDVILMDVHMPITSGIEATEQIRALERKMGTHMPIFALTADVASDAVERCLAAGIDDVISKPANFPDLLKKLRGMIIKARNQEK
jgi:CheY-like chemotaxis protein